MLYVCNPLSLPRYTYYNAYEDYKYKSLRLDKKYTSVHNLLVDKYLALEVFNTDLNMARLLFVDDLIKLNNSGVLIDGIDFNTKTVQLSSKSKEFESEYERLLFDTKKSFISFRLLEVQDLVLFDFSLRTKYIKDFNMVNILEVRILDKNN